MTQRIYLSLSKVNYILKIWIVSIFDNCRLHEVVELLVEPVFVNKGQDRTDKLAEEDHPKNRRELTDSLEF
jgi:hypothetical protein